MPSNLKKSLILFPALGLIATGCSDTEGQAKFRVSAGTEGTSTQALVQGLTQVEASAAASASFQSSDGVSLTLTEARVNLRDIQLELEKGVTCESVEAQLVAPARCKSEGSGSHTIEIAGPFVIDLLTGASTPDMSAARVPAGTYRRIDFRLDDAKENVEQTDVMLNNSFVAKASFEQDGEPRVLELALKFNEDHRVEAPDGIVVGGENAELLLMLKPAEWLKDVPLAECLEGGDVTVDGNIVRLDDKSGGGCSGVENLLKRNIKTSADLKGSAEVKSEK